MRWSVSNIILPIYDKHLDNICTGSKTFEFRKRCLPEDPLYIVFVRIPVTTNRVVLARVDRVLKDYPEKLWPIVKDVSGLTAHEFFCYYTGVKTGVAYSISHIYEVPETCDVSVFGSPTGMSALTSEQEVVLAEILA